MPHNAGRLYPQFTDDLNIQNATTSVVTDRTPRTMPYVHKFAM